MATEEIEKIDEHKIVISYIDDDEIFKEEDEIVITLKSNEIIKIVVNSKSSSSVEFDDNNNPIKPNPSVPCTHNGRALTVVWDLPSNSRYIKRIARYGCNEKKYVYTFHWEKTSLSSKKYFFKSLLKFFWGGLSGKSGSGGGLMK